MSEKINSNSLHLHATIHLIIILFSYVVFASVFGYAYRYAINPDGVSLLRLAGYIAEGNFQHSVTSGWPPLITWVFAPFLVLGLDGLTSARIAIALCGGGMVLICWFLASKFYLSDNIKFLSVMIAALLISFWTIYAITPDILLATFILFYLYLASEPDIITNKKLAFFCGIVGGFSFLAHHSALPLFFSHFPLILIVTTFIVKDKKSIALKKAFKTWGIGMAGFLIIASIWISAMSFKYGHLTISSAGPIAHAIMGPKDMERRHPFFVGGLYKPRESHQIHVFEDPSDVKFKDWSPFESREYFLYQLKIIKDNAVYILNHFVNNSPFFVYASIIGVLCIIPIALFLSPLDDKKKFLYLWVIMTFILYCSIFLLTIARSPRRFYALMIVFLFLSFHFVGALTNGVTNVMSERSKKLLSFYLLFIVVSAFALKPAIQFLKSARHIITREQVNPYREMAEQINTVNFPAPYAIIRSSQKPHTDYYMAYYIGKQLLGRPLSRDVEGITKELKDAGARSLIVFDNQAIVEKILNDGRYVKIGSKELSNNLRYSFAVNIKQDEIKEWDKEVNIFTLKQ
jgi:hypothetical protein